MSSISGISSSSGASYAVQLAQTSKLGRSLNSLDAAVQSGNLASAGSVLAAIVKDNPQFALSSSSTTAAQDPINQGFNAVSTAISNNQPEAAKSAWNQLKTDLAKSGVIVNDGSEDTRKLLADAKKSIDNAILASLGSSASDGGSSLASLVGAGTTDGADSLSALVSNWVTYKAGGGSSTTSTNPTAAESASTASPAVCVATTAASGSNLNVTA